uniref:Uncharacterized protein n=1 Tax=Anopheles arabiensis TaxID=7173 RepID=A0A182I263_ANOAR
MATALGQCGVRVGLSEAGSHIRRADATVRLSPSVLVEQYTNVPRP